MEVIVKEKLEHEVSELRITKEKHENDIQELKAMVEELRRPNSNCFQDYTQDSSCHGLRYIFRDRKINIRSCIWSVALVAAAGFYIYFATEALARYFSYPLVSSIAVVDVNAMAFPAVTVCPGGKIRKSYVEEQYKMGRFLPIKDLTVNQHDLFRFFWLKKNELVVIDEEDMKNLNEHNYIDYLSKSKEDDLRQMYEREMISINWETACLRGGFNASSTFVHAEFSVDYKVESFPHYIWCQCHKVTFNYEANKAKDKRIAPLVLNLQPSEYTYHEDGAEAYVVITFSEPSEYADPWKFDLLLEDGDIFDVRLEKQIESNLPAPYSSCLDTHARDFVSPLHHHGDYSYDACHLECESRQLEEQRGCRLIGVPSQNQTLAATCPISKSPMKTGVTCEHCRTPCTATKYAPFLVTRHRPAGSHVKHLFVEFKDLRHTKLTRSPAYPPEALLGDLGGNLGLQMGASALTVLEFVDVLACVVWGKLVRNVHDATHS